MNSYDRLYIDKPMRTLADELVAFGVMRLADDIYSSTPHTIVLRDCGSYNEITLDPPITPDMLAQVGLIAPIPFIKTLKNADSLPSDAPSVDYEYWKDIRKQYFAAQDHDGLTQPHEHWDIFRAVNPAALPGYTSVLGNWWRVQPQLPDVLTLIFNLFSQSPNDLEGAVAIWKDMDKHFSWGIKPDATCQQLFNPDQGKGQNKVKADGLSVGNIDNFWLVEFLKMVGFYEAAMTRTVKGGKDRKTFVVAPHELDFAKHTDLMSRFRASMRAAENSIRFDILASLRYTRTLIEYYLEPEAPPEPWLQGIYYPAQEVSGFRTGLDPYAGFLHADRPGKPSLVLDFIEEFRQEVVDRVVFGLANRGYKVGQTSDGLLTKETRRDFAEKILSHLEAGVRYEGREKDFVFSLPIKLCTLSISPTSTCSAKGAGGN